MHYKRQMLMRKSENVIYKKMSRFTCNFKKKKDGRKGGGNKQLHLKCVLVTHCSIHSMDTSGKALEVHCLIAFNKKWR